MHFHFISGYFFQTTKKHKNMKKTYITPKIQETRINVSRHLLTESETIPIRDDLADVNDETNDYNTLSRHHQSVWDDKEDF